MAQFENIIVIEPGPAGIQVVNIVTVYYAGVKVAVQVDDDGHATFRTVQPRTVQPSADASNAFETIYIVGFTAAETADSTEFTADTTALTADAG